MEKTNHRNSNYQGSGMTTLIADKNFFKIDYQRKRGTFHKDKKVKFSRRYDNNIYVYMSNDNTHKYVRVKGEIHF